MNDLAVFFSSIGAPKESDIKMALHSFIDEYNDNCAQKNVIDIIQAVNPLLPIILKSGLLDGVRSKLASWRKSKSAFVSKLAPEEGLGLGTRTDLESVLGKLCRMVVLNEGAGEFNLVSDYARIAAHVYGNRKDTILSKQWTYLGNRYHNLQLDDEKSGLQAALYCKKGDTPQYVYAIAGTRGSDIKDWKANAGQLIGYSDQYERACEIAAKLSDRLGISRLVMVGHSKGGGQAAYCALRTGCDAITFNPAGLGLSKFKQNRRGNPRINSYVMIKDPLNMMQLLAQLMSVDITADGSVHYLKNDKNSPISEWHGIDGFLRLGGMNDMQRLPKG